MSEVSGPCFTINKIIIVATKIFAVAKIIFFVTKITYFRFSKNLSSYSKILSKVSVPCFVVVNFKLAEAKMDLKIFLYFPLNYS